MNVPSFSAQLDAQKRKARRAGFSDFICPRGELAPTCPKASAAILSLLTS